LQFPYGMVNETGEYAVCHFVDQDVFSMQDLKLFFMGREIIQVIGQMKIAHLLIREWWAKHTSEIYGNAIPRRKPSPTLIMIPVSNIISTCVDGKLAYYIHMTVNHSETFVDPVL